jgi:pimeloyl-ACP methyl ester carboxylesterase
VGVVDFVSDELELLEQNAREAGLAWWARPAVQRVALTAALRSWAAHQATVVGMSLGGLVTIRLAAVATALIRHAVLVDVTPSAQARRAATTPAEQGPVA